MPNPFYATWRAATSLGGGPQRARDYDEPEVSGIHDSERNRSEVQNLYQEDDEEEVEEKDEAAGASSEDGEAQGSERGAETPLLMRRQRSYRRPKEVDLDTRIEPVSATDGSWIQSFFRTLKKNGGGGVGISPSSPYVMVFDRVLVLALFITATFTVFYVTIVLTQPMPGRKQRDHPFDHFSVRLLVDVVMDFIFFLDFVLGFFRAYREEGGQGRLVYDLREIRMRYVKRPGFILDLLSSIPYDLTVFIVMKVFEVKSQNLRFLRLVRLFRVHRGFRIVNQSVAFQQFALSVDSRIYHMVRLVLGLILLLHWAACWWVWLGREEILLEDDRTTWIDRLEREGFEFDRDDYTELYLIGVYWASTVSSSVGSGDIVPTNPIEATFVATFQILGGCLFAYAVSSLVGLYAALHAHEEGRGAAVDAVNEMLNELTMEHASVDAQKIRTFVAQACDARAFRTRRRFAPGGALSHLSPQLRDEVVLAERQPWLDKIWYIKGARPRLARALAREAKWVTYAPGDHVTLSVDQAVVITRGVCTTRSQVLVRGSALGIEGCATNVTANLSRSVAIAGGLPRTGPSFLALTFSEALMLESGAVERAVRTEGSEDEFKRWMRARVLYGMKRWARKLRAGSALSTPIVGPIPFGTSGGASSNRSRRLNSTGMENLSLTPGNGSPHPPAQTPSADEPLRNNQTVFQT